MKTVEVLGQRVDQVSFEEVMDEIDACLKAKKRALVFAMNVHNLVKLEAEKGFKAEYEKRVAVVYTDGVPLVWMSKMTKTPLPGRVSGTDLAKKLLSRGKHKIFLVGSSEEVLDKMKQKYRCVVGVYSPPKSEKWSAKENIKIVEKVRKSKAQVLMVGVGALKQERWLLANFEKTKATIGMGVGSAFDILSGKTPRAPRFLRDNGFEWLWRMWLEPKRLGKRYLEDVARLGRLSLKLFKLS